MLEETGTPSGNGEDGPSGGIGEGGSAVIDNPGVTNPTKGNGVELMEGVSWGLI